MDKDESKVQPVSDDTVPAAHAGMLLAPWSRLSRRLVPLIGENGFGALFGRSLRLVAPRHVWLQVEGTYRSSAAVLAALELVLASVDGTAAAAANDELMGTFTRQLGALIGPGLTTRLLAETAIGDEKPKHHEEHK